jgi:hypothetical protein
MVAKGRRDSFEELIVGAWLAPRSVEVTRGIPFNGISPVAPRKGRASERDECSTSQPCFPISAETMGKAEGEPLVGNGCFVDWRAGENGRETGGEIEDAGEKTGD